jgi:hypothetical protein
MRPVIASTNCLVAEPARHLVPREATALREVADARGAAHALEPRGEPARRRQLSDLGHVKAGEGGRHVDARGSTRLEDALGRWGAPSRLPIGDRVAAKPQFSRKSSLRTLAAHGAQQLARGQLEVRDPVRFEHCSATLGPDLFESD